MGCPTQYDDEYCTLPELARWLRVSERHVQRLLEIGDGPPSIRLGRRVIFSRVAVQKWLEARTSGPASPSGEGYVVCRVPIRRRRSAIHERGLPVDHATGGDHERS
jgi:excisionase family DNA binding protein